MKAEDAARLAPWSGQVQNTLGDVLLADGKKAEALQAYETALRIEESCAAGFAGGGCSGGTSEDCGR